MNKQLEIEIADIATSLARAGRIVLHAVADVGEGAVRILKSFNERLALDETALGSIR